MLLSLVLAAAAAVPHDIRTPADPRFAAIRRELTAAVEGGTFPSVSVAVIENGKTVWEESIGAMVDTGYLVASLGKSITATGVLKLADEGKIDLAAPADRYLGNAPLTIYAGKSDDVTVTRVLDMTAEIPHGGLSFSSLAARNEYTTASLVRNRGMVVFPPGTIAMYSNMNYAVAEQMIETVTGKSFRAFMHDDVFAPLGMEHSSVGPNGDGYNMPASSLSMYVSLDDLVQYARFHFGAKPFLRPATLEMMHNHRSGVEHSPLALGIGHVDLADGGVFLLTNGSARGGQSTLGIFPREHSAVMCLINATGNRADDIAFRLADIIHPGFQKEMESVIADYEKWADRPLPSNADFLGIWRGTIVNRQTRLPIELLFQTDGDVHVKVGNQRETLVKLAYHNGLLSGTFLAEIDAEEKPGHAHPVTISLLRDGNRMTGFVRSDFANERGSFSLASYVALEKRD